MADELTCTPLLLQQPERGTKETSSVEMETEISSSCPGQFAEQERPEATGGEVSLQSHVSVQSDTGSVGSGTKVKPKGESKVTIKAQCLSVLAGSEGVASYMNRLICSMPLGLEAT